MKRLLAAVIILFSLSLQAQQRWMNVDSLYQPLPASIHVYKTTQPVDTGTFVAYYVEADLKDKHLLFDADTTLNRRFTPAQFYEKDKPLVVVNCTFFSFETNRSLNTVIKDGKLVGYNIHTIAGRGKDTLTYRHLFTSVIGIDKKRKADVAWLYTDSSFKYPLASQVSFPVSKDSFAVLRHKDVKRYANSYKLTPTVNMKDFKKSFHKWKMKTAVGGGPMLLQDGEINITNNEELKFSGKAINDKHPRTAMGYTADNKLIILVVQGRSESSGGASLTQEAELLKEIGCTEALNLDGGGSSCMLINGKETIKPSDKTGQRPVPAVFVIKNK